MRRFFAIIIVGGLVGAGWYFFSKPQLKDDDADEEKQVCIQVITPAKNLKTGEVKNFPTPCDVPEGWEKIEAQVQNPPVPQTSNPPAGGPPPAPAETWQTYSSNLYGYQLEFPKSWSEAEQMDGAFVDFGPGNVQIGGGDMALDVSCIYAAGIEEGSEGSVEKKTVIYGSNTYVEEKSAATHTFQTDIPAKNQKNGCPYAMFILRKDVGNTILEKILSSFRFN